MTVGIDKFERLGLIVLILLLLFLPSGCNSPAALQRSEGPPQSPHYPVYQTNQDYLVLAYGENRVIDFTKGSQRLSGQLEELITSFPTKSMGKKLINKREHRENGKIIAYWPYLSQEYSLAYNGTVSDLDRLLESLTDKVEEIGGKVLKKQQSGFGREKQVVLEVGLHQEVFKNNWFAPTVYQVTFSYLPLGKPISGGKVAIIIDDLGSNAQGTDQIFSLNLPLTVAVLPHRPYSKREAERAKDSGFQVILHQPMEPLSPDQNPGAGLVTDQMSDEEITETVKTNFRSIPHAVGINNHMGSKGTGDERVVGAVLKAAKDEGVFFLDSRTSSQSVVPAMASRIKLPSAVNRVFLDNQKEVGYIKGQIEKLINLAEKDGEAVGIGHVHPATAQAISQMIPLFEERGIDLVYVQELIK